MDKIIPARFLMNDDVVTTSMKKEFTTRFGEKGYFEIEITTRPEETWVELKANLDGWEDSYGIYTREEFGFLFEAIKEFMNSENTPSIR